ncbi:MAG: molybdate ABC transporter substrate-binding protein [Dehalococcoidia bacterium]|nr:MAG: molybdate ABC transporter substrate-binding protein [Dehalococcoidia bacterium]
MAGEEGMVCRKRDERAAKVLFASLLLVLPMFITGCDSASTSVAVFAAAGAKPAMDEAAERFQEQYGIQVEVSSGGGGEVLARMVLAETGDVYIAPEQEFMKSAVEQGAVDPKTIKTVAYMIPVLAVQKGNRKHVTALSDLARPGMRVAITRPEATLLGKYAPEIFQKAGLAEEIGKNIVAEAARPDLLVTWLIMGEVDGVITWHFYQSLAPDDIEVVLLPPEQLTGIGEMQVAVSTYSNNRELAERFVDFLASAEGEAVFSKHGYIVDAEELEKYWPAARR